MGSDSDPDDAACTGPDCFGTVGAGGGGGAGGASCEADQNVDPSNCGRCGHDCQGGTCVDGVCQPFVFAELTERPVAIEVGAEAVYWASQDGIWSCDKSGCGQGGPQLRLGTSEAPRSLTQDDDHLYWSGRDEPGIFRVSKAGGPREVLTGWVNPHEPDEGTGIAVAVGASRLFWMLPHGSWGCVVFACPLAACEGHEQQVFQQHAVASDYAVAAGEELFFAIRDMSLGPGGEIHLKRLDCSSGPCQATTLDVQGPAHGGRLVVSSSAVHWVAATRLLRFDRASGGESTTVFARHDMPVDYLVGDERTVSWLIQEESWTRAVYHCGSSACVGNSQRLFEHPAEISGHISPKILGGGEESLFFDRLDDAGPVMMKVAK